MARCSDIRIVVGLDFGVKFSSFAYAHKSNPNEIIVHHEWQEYHGFSKVPTVLKYDESFNLISWGYPALAERPNRRKRNTDILVERFKLYLSRIENKPYLPNGLDYKKAITDYLREIGKVIKCTLYERLPSFDFFRQVLVIMTVPAEFDNQAIGIMRECVFKAGITDSEHSRNLIFTTEPEATAIHCMKALKDDVGVGSSFMVVDCGGETIDLTLRKLLPNEKLSETIERSGYYCGGSFVDQEFLKFLGCKVGYSAIKLLEENQYVQLQYMIQEFCRCVKFPFTGQRKDYRPFYLDLDELCPVIKQYVEGTELDKLEEEEWIVDVSFEDVKAMFDPVIERIIQLINSQLSSSDNCPTLSLVGEFSESIYLQSRIKQEFNTRVRVISIPLQPATAIVKGAVQYGLGLNIVGPRVLKYTYGINVTRKWNPSDPIERKLPNGMINAFLRIAKRGDEINTNSRVSIVYSSAFNGLELYCSHKNDVKYCDDPGVMLLCRYDIDMPTFSKTSAILITLIFGIIEIKVIAQNIKTGDKYECTFDMK